MRRLAITLALLFCALAPSAHAASYTVNSCRLPDGSPAPINGWTPNTTGGPGQTYADSCATGGSLAVGLKGQQTWNQLDGVRLVFQPPPGVSVQGWRIWRSVQRVTSTMYYAVYPTEQFFMIPGPGVDECTTGCAGLGTTARWDDPSNAAAGDETAKPWSQLVLWTYCAANASQCANEQHDVASAIQLYRASIDLTDSDPPTFTNPPSGDLITQGATLSGTKAVTYAAQDVGSGVYRAVLEVDGKTVKTQPAGGEAPRCAEPFVDLVPCSAKAGGTLDYDTTQVANGPHTVTLRVQDATGSNAAVYGPISVNVDNPKPIVVSSVIPAVIKAGVVGRKTTTVTTSFKGKVTIQGTLTTPAGARLPNQTISVKGRQLVPNAPTLPLPAVTTDKTGTFRLLAPTGPSRAISFNYGTGTASVTIKRRASAVLNRPKAPRAGTTVRFTGLLRGGPVPRGGVPVELQVLERGKWRDLAAARARGAAGAFKVSYHFGRGVRDQTYSLRVRLSAVSDYPYVADASPPIKVHFR